MIKTVDVKLSVSCSYQDVFNKAIKKLSLDASKVKYFSIVKKSLDARDKSNIFYLYRCEVSTAPYTPSVKEYKKVGAGVSVLVVGAGPAGLFCALDLLRYGFSVTLIERGKKVEEREKDVLLFQTSKQLNEESNVQFGEGGAGAFSDGKLNTQVGGEYVKEVVKDFVYFGAPEEVGYLNKPHVGSDNLKKVVKNIRAEILKLGGKVLYQTKLTGIVADSGKVKCVYVNGNKCYYDEVVLAVGHSARDVYKMLYDSGILLQATDFAVGYRIEHLREDVNVWQYGKNYNKSLPTADYKLTSSYMGRGVFTFCMCPGGVVIPSSSEKETVVVNGMSNFSRSEVNSNSAVITQVKASELGEDIFAGVNFQKEIERKAFILGGENYCAPVQLVKDFLQNETSIAFEKVIPSYSIGTKMADLNDLLPQKYNDCLKFGLTDMNKKLNGFISSGAVLTGVESRTSSPIRVLRGENFCSLSASNLYPCGEGCGYAGGIASAGADGKKVANALKEKYDK